MKSPIKVRKKDEKREKSSDVAASQPSPAQVVAAAKATSYPDPAFGESADTVDLERRRTQLATKVAELQWDLGGLVYEMAVRNRLRPDVLVKRAAALQEVDAELGEVERILRMERTGVAALCLSCGAPHSSGAVFCWQCGRSLLEEVSSTTIAASRA